MHDTRALCWDAPDSRPSRYFVERAHVVPRNPADAAFLSLAAATARRTTTRRPRRVAQLGSARARSGAAAAARAGAARCSAAPLLRLLHLAAAASCVRRRRTPLGHATAPGRLLTRARGVCSAAAGAAARSAAAQLEQCRRRRSAPYARRGTPRYCHPHAKVRSSVRMRPEPSRLVAGPSSALHQRRLPSLRRCAARDAP